MFIRGGLGVRTSGAAAGTPAFELIAPPTKNCILRELIITLAAATASAYGLGRPAAIGVTPTTPVNALREGIGDGIGMLSKTALAWGTPPTSPTVFNRRASLSATIGDFVDWVFDGGLYIPAGQSIVLWNIGTNSVVDLNIIIDE